MRGETNNSEELIHMKNFSRRDFVQSGAIVAAACATSGVTPASAQSSRSQAKPSPLRLGLASYTFRNFHREQLIGFMKQLNVNALNAKNINDHLPNDPQEEAQAVADYAKAGIILHAAGDIDILDDDDAAIRSKFEYCKRANIPMMVARDPMPETLPRIERILKEYDIRVAINDHGKADKIWPSTLDALKAIKHMDPRIGCCVDVGHFVRSNIDVVQAIHEMGPRLFDVHIKDLPKPPIEKDQPVPAQVAVGDGIMPVREIFQALIAIQYGGYIDLEYEVFPDDPMPGVIASFAFMRGVLAGMGFENNA
jgi:sugar phosphate isomerase/epimerase